MEGHNVVFAVNSKIGFPTDERPWMNIILLSYNLYALHQEIAPCTWLDICAGEQLSALVITLHPDDLYIDDMYFSPYEEHT